MSEKLSDNLISIGAYNYILYYLDNDLIADSSIRGKKNFEYYQQAMIDMAVPFEEAEKYINDEDTNIQTIAFNFYMDRVKGIYPLSDEDSKFIQHRRLTQVAEIDFTTPLPSLQIVNFDLIKQFWNIESKIITNEQKNPQSIRLIKNEETNIQNNQYFNYNQIEEKNIDQEIKQNLMKQQENQIEEKEGQNNIKIIKNIQNQQFQEIKRSITSSNDIQNQSKDITTINSSQQKSSFDDQTQIDLSPTNQELIKAENQQTQFNPKEDQKFLPHSILETNFQNLVNSQLKLQEETNNKVKILNQQPYKVQLLNEEILIQKQNQQDWFYQNNQQQQQQQSQFSPKEDQKFPPHLTVETNYQNSINSQLKLQEKINNKDKSLNQKHYNDQLLMEEILIKDQNQQDQFHQNNQEKSSNKSIPNELDTFTEQVEIIPTNYMDDLDKLTISTLDQPDIIQFTPKKEQLPLLLHQPNYGIIMKKPIQVIFTNQFLQQQSIKSRIKIKKKQTKYYNKLTKCRKKKNIQIASIMEQHDRKINHKNIKEQNSILPSQFLEKLNEVNQSPSKNKSIFSQRKQISINQIKQTLSLKSNNVKHNECIIHNHRQILRKQKSFIQRKNFIQKVKKKPTHKYLFNTKKHFLINNKEYSIIRNLLPHSTIQTLMIYHKLADLIPHISLIQAQNLQRYLEEKNYNFDEMILIIEDLKVSKQILRLLLAILPYVENSNVYNKEILIDITEGKQTSSESIILELFVRNQIKTYNILPYEFYQWRDQINQSHKVKIYLSGNIIKTLYPQKRNHEQYQAMQLHYNAFTNTNEAKQLVKTLDEIIKQKIFPTHFIKTNFHQLLKITELDYICINNEYSIFKEKIWISYYKVILPNEKKRIILQDGKSIVNYVNFRISKNRSLIAERQKGLKVDIQPDITGYKDKIIIEISNKTNQKKQLRGFNLYIK